MASASIFLFLSAACSVQGPLIRPCMEYGSHVWECLTHTALLNRIESKDFYIINSPPLTDCLDYLSHRRNVAFLSNIYRYFHGDCSSELANCMPAPLQWLRCTRLSTSSHPYSVHFPNSRVNQYIHSFIPYTCKLWNSLPLSIFPPAYDYNSYYFIPSIVLFAESFFLSILKKKLQQVFLLS